MPPIARSRRNLLCRARVGCVCRLVICRSWGEPLGMSTQPVLLPVLLAAATDPLMRGVAAYLARFKYATRVYTAPDLRAFLVWCGERRLAPLNAQRVHIELYVRWMQEVRRLKPSTVSRRMSVVAGFYRTCVIDQVLPHSPADYVRRPNVAPESPTLGCLTCSSKPCCPPPSCRPLCRQGHRQPRRGPDPAEPA